MPIYTFKNKRTKKEFTEMMSIAEMEEYLLKNKHIRQVITPINISGGVMGVNMKNDGGWKDNLSRIAEAHPNTPLGHKYSKKTIKEQKTRQVLKKHGVL